jgi:hypothetical protein
LHQGRHSSVSCLRIGDFVLLSFSVLAQQDPPASRSRASLTCHATSGITPKSALRFIARSRARKKVKRVQTLGSATVDAVTIVNPAVRLTLCTWIGCDAVAFILRLLAGAGRFVFKRIVALIPAARRPCLDRGSGRPTRGCHFVGAAPITTPRVTSKNIESPSSLDIPPSIPNPFDTRIVVRPLSGRLARCRFNLMLFLPLPRIMGRFRQGVRQSKMTGPSRCASCA